MAYKIRYRPAGEMYYGMYTDSFSSDVKCFIQKPIENEELIKRVHQIIEVMLASLSQVS